ncbi:hypothetical protein ACJJTC_018722, partial [Scirpophaga incertulas]
MSVSLRVAKMDCTGCREALSELNSLKCNACDSHYCLECLCLDTNKKSSELNQDQLSALKCPSCTNVSRRKRGGKDMSSVFSPSVMKPKHNIENILTIEKISNLLDQKLDPKSSIMLALRKELIQDVKSMIAIETSKTVTAVAACSTVFHNTCRYCKKKYTNNGMLNIG